MSFNLLFQFPFSTKFDKKLLIKTFKSDMLIQTSLNLLD